MDKIVELVNVNSYETIGTCNHEFQSLIMIKQGAYVHIRNPQFCCVTIVYKKKSL